MTDTVWSRAVEGNGAVSGGVVKRSTSDMVRWLTPQEVGQMAGGFTAQFIRMEIKAGIIPAKLVISRRGRLGRYRITAKDAQAYVNQLHNGV